MTAVNFPACLAEVLKWEGGWSDQAVDPGHETMHGITLATYREYVPDATADDLRAIPDDEVETIYEAGYWKPICGDDLPSGVDMICFDAAVNQGPRRAAETLQEALGVTADGIVGPRTLAAATDDPRGLAGLVQDISALRLAFYQSLPTYADFGVGWTRRLTDVTAKAIALANAT